MSEMLQCGLILGGVLAGLLILCWVTPMRVIGTRMEDGVDKVWRP